MLAVAPLAATADLYQFTFTDPVGTRTVKSANSIPLQASQACNYYFSGFRGDARHRWGTSPNGTATWQSGGTSRTFNAGSASSTANCPQRYQYDSCGCGNPGQWFTNTATVATAWQGASNAPTRENTGAPAPTACVANPINVATGNKFQTELDYAAAAGVLPLEFRRYYSSDLPRRGDLSHQWTHSYSARVDLDAAAGVASLTRPDGKVLRFVFDSASATWQPASDVTYALTRLLDGSGQPVGWKAVGRDNVSELYDATGRLTQRQHPSGFSQSLSYDAAGHLVGVSDSWGRSLTFEYTAFQYDADRITALIDPASQRYEYVYDAARNLASVTYPDAKSRTYHYEDSDHPHALTGITDENNVRFATWAYDAYGRAISSTHAGSVDDFTLTHNPDGTTVVTDPLGKTRTYSFDYTLGVYRVQGLTEPCAGNRDAALDYDANGFIASRTDFNGNVTTYVHNARGLETSRTEAFGTALARTITTQWHATLRLPTQVDEPGRRTVYTYDASGNRESETVLDTVTGEARTTTWTYTGLGLVDTVNGPRTDVSDITDFDYDAQGNLVQIRNALNQITQIPEYDAHGNPTKIIDANGVQTLLTYDVRQRLKTRTVAGATTTYDYSAVGLLDKVTLPDGAFVDYTYDLAHRLTDVEDNFGNRIHYTLDGMGNRTKEEVFDPANVLKRAHSQVFDTLGRLQQIRNAANQVVTEFGYDPQGNRTSQVDAGVYTTTFVPDALNRMAQSTDAATGVTQYGYSALDQLESVQDPKGLVTSYQSNALGDLKQLTSPDTGATLSTYDAAGNRKTQTDARGVTVAYSYDALNRLTFVNYPGTVEDVVYSYDGSNYTGSVPNGIGRLTGITDQSGVTEYRYDARGNLTQEMKTIAGHTYTTTYSHDAADRLASITYPSGRVVNYPRDATGRITSVTAMQGATTTPLATSLSYLPHGPQTGMTLGNGLPWQADFDANYRLTHLTAGAVQDLTYTHDLRNNITAITDAIHSARSQTFGLDALSRLTSGAGAYGALSWTYDGVGNRLTHTATPPGGSAATDMYSYPATSHRLQGVSGAAPMSFGYDAAGNTTQKGDGVFQYNNAQRLSRIERTGPLGATRIAEATYNALGQRVTKTLYRPAAAGQSGEPVTVVFHYDAGGHLLAETCADGRLVAEYAYLDDVPLALWRRPKDLLAQAGGEVVHECQLDAGVLPPTSLYYFHADHLGTPQKLTDTGGQIAWDAIYEPFGEVTLATEEVTQPLRYPGQYFDAETGLHQNWFRDYDPSTGRYLQSDPIGLRGGLNTYAYAGVNPTNIIDPYGLWGWAGAGLGAVSGGIGGFVSTGTIRGAVAGAAAGAVVGFVAPQSAGPAGVAAANFVASLVGQEAGSYRTTGSLIPAADLNYAAAAGAAVGASAGNAVAGSLGRGLWPSIGPVVGSDLYTSTLSYTGTTIATAIGEGIGSGLGEGAFPAGSTPSSGCP